MFTVYILYNIARNKIYIGQTNNLEERLKRHNKILPSKKIAFTSKQSGEWEIIYQERYNDRKTAMSREQQLKTARGRKFIWDRVKSDTK